MKCILYCNYDVHLSLCFPLTPTSPSSSTPFLVLFSVCWSCIFQLMYVKLKRHASFWYRWPSLRCPWLFFSRCVWRLSHIQRHCVWNRGQCIFSRSFDVHISIFSLYHYMFLSINQLLFKKLCVCCFWKVLNYCNDAACRLWLWTWMWNDWKMFKSLSHCVRGCLKIQIRFTWITVCVVEHMVWLKFETLIYGTNIKINS